MQLGEKIILSCTANTEHVRATWEKNGKELQCVADKHFIKRRATEFSLEIVDAGENDDGKYTINLKNRKGEVSCFASVKVGM